MMSSPSYHQFCPVAMAAEVLCGRWTLLLVRELMMGATHFNALHRGVPRMSSALLATRLKELEAAGVVVRSEPQRAGDAPTYHLSAAGQELRPIVEAIGVWGQRWVATDALLRRLDANLLMWDMRRNLVEQALPEQRTTVQFLFSDRPVAVRNYWLIVRRGAEPDLCTIDPGLDVDLYVSTDVRTLTEVWLGHVTLAQARQGQRLQLAGSRALAQAFGSWLRLSPFAAVAPAQAQAQPVALPG